MKLGLWVNLDEQRSSVFSCSYIAMTDKKSKNRQTALLLALAVALFFIAVVIKQMWFS
jgi:hypothetical protein